MKKKKPTSKSQTKRVETQVKDALRKERTEREKRAGVPEHGDEDSNHRSGRRGR